MRDGLDSAPEFATEESDLIDEEFEEWELAKRGCCFWIPFCGPNGPRRAGTWQRIWTTSPEKEVTTRWWKSVSGFLKVRERSEVVAGPKWNTYIRRFNRNRPKHNKFQYDAFSYARNFDRGHGDHDFDDNFVFRDFSSRYALVPLSVNSSMNFGKDAPSFR